MYSEFLIADYYELLLINMLYILFCFVLLYFLTHTHTHTLEANFSCKYGCNAIFLQGTVGLSTVIKRGTHAASGLALHHFPQSQSK